MSTEKPGSGPYKRSWKNYLIDPAFQLKYAFWISGTGVLLVGSIAALFYRYIRENYAILVELSPMTDELKIHMWAELDRIMIQLGLISALFLVCVTLLGIVISHKAAGAVYHFKKVFRQIAEGKTDARIRLRPGDDFQEAAQEFNSMMDRLNVSPKSDRTSDQS